MAIWNTAVSVIALVEAESGEEAVRLLTASLSRKGYDVEANGEPFESEPLDFDVEPLP